MSLRCHLGYHDREWKRETYLAPAGYRLVKWVATPQYEDRERQAGTCTRCGDLRRKDL